MAALLAAARVAAPAEMAHSAIAERVLLGRLERAGAVVEENEELGRRQLVPVVVSLPVALAIYGMPFSSRFDDLL